MLDHQRVTSNPHGEPFGGASAHWTVQNDDFTLNEESFSSITDNTGTNNISGGFLKWDYPQASSILDWDFPKPNPSIFAM